MTSPVMPPDYQPSETEAYMNANMLEFFRQRLQAWKHELQDESNLTIHSLAEEGGIQEPDLADRATAETDRGLELRTRDRFRKLLGKIDEALDRIDDKSYGYCEETGEPIGIKRLMARPNATLSIEAQERHEREEKIHRDD